MEDVESVEIEPEDIDEIEFEDDFQPQTVQPRRKVPPNERTTPPVLDKYTVAKLIGFRARQLEAGAQPVIPRSELKSTRPEKIAEQELERRVIPLKVIRNLPDNTYEEWNIKDFKYIRR